MSRERTVYPKEMVAHLWASGQSTNARTATGNLFLAPVYVSAPDGAGPSRDDSAIWSYGRHFCLARMLPGARILWNANRYSVTTAKHQSITRQALRSHVSAGGWFNVNNPGAASKREHLENFADYRARYEAEISACEKPRIRAATRAAHASLAADLLAEANAYAALFRLGRRLRPINGAAIAARLKREERAAQKQRAAEEERRKAEHAAALAEAADAVTEWRAGSRSTDTLPHIVRYGRGALLRLRGDTVETSAGAKFPADDARKVWPLIVATRKAGRAFVPSGLRGASFGDFALTRIDADGSVIAGCHTVPFAECAALAVALGLPDSETFAYTAAQSF